MTGGYKTTNDDGVTVAVPPDGPKCSDRFGPFTIISMYHMRYMANSQLFQALTEKNLSARLAGCNYNRRILTYKACFGLCYVNNQSAEISRHRKELSVDRRRIVRFLKDNFDSMHPEEINSIHSSFDRGDTLYIIGFDSKEKVHFVLAAIMYITCMEGSYINWFAVSHQTNNCDRFGSHANNQPF